MHHHQFQLFRNVEPHISGLNFMVRQISYEVFTYDERRPEPLQYEDTPRELFPYMVGYLISSSE